MRLLAAVLLLLPVAAFAQPLDMSHGGPVALSSANGGECDQAMQRCRLMGEARAVRGDVTVIADQLVAYLRHRAADAPAPGPVGTGADTGSSEIYRLEAIGHVRIYTQTDQAQADHAVYDIDQAVLVMTGHDLKVTTPQDVLTARDSLEYWSQRHMSVARGAAVVVTNDAKRFAADTLVAYSSDTAPAQKISASADPADNAGRLQRVEAFGNVEIRTATQTVSGDRGVYLPDSGLANLVGHARLTQGGNHVEGEALQVDLHSGIYKLLAAPGARVQGLLVPNDSGAPVVPK